MPINSIMPPSWRVTTAEKRDTIHRGCGVRAFPRTGDVLLSGDHIFRFFDAAAPSGWWSHSQVPHRFSTRVVQGMVVSLFFLRLGCFGSVASFLSWLSYLFGRWVRVMPLSLPWLTAEVGARCVRRLSVYKACGVLFCWMCANSRAKPRDWWSCCVDSCLFHYTHVYGGAGACVVSFGFVDVSVALIPSWLVVCSRW